MIPLLLAGVEPRSALLPGAESAPGALQAGVGLLYWSGWTTCFGRSSAPVLSPRFSHEHGPPVSQKTLEGTDLAALGHNSPEYIYRVAMAMKAAFADRNRHLGDPEFVDVPLEGMTSKERAAEWRRAIDAGEPIDVPDGVVESPDTTHVTVVDGSGNAVALTHSLGASSGVITPGLGFMFNNSIN